MSDCTRCHGDGWLLGTHRWLGIDYDTASPCPFCRDIPAVLEYVWGAREDDRLVCAHGECGGRRTCRYDISGTGEKPPIGEDGLPLATLREMPK